MVFPKVCIVADPLGRPWMNFYLGIRPTEGESAIFLPSLRLANTTSRHFGILPEKAVTKGFGVCHGCLFCVPAGALNHE